jgi:transcriptional regulator with XRE-family HTH domain
MKAGLSQKDLAARAGVRVETLCRIEKGHHTASAPTITKIEKALMGRRSRRAARRRSVS